MSSAPGDTSPFAEDYAAWKRWSAADFGRPDAEARLYYAREVFARAPAAAPSLLELGFGNGALLACARERGCRVEGVEANAALLATAEQAGYVVHRAIAACAPASFDVVAAFDVIEHVPEGAIVELLGHVHTVLVPGGIFIARFPNGDSPFARRLQHGDATHVTTIGSEKARWYARKAGFAVTYAGNPAQVYAGLGAGRFARRVLAGAVRGAIEHVVGHAYFGQRMALDPTLVVVFRKDGARP